MPAIEVTNSKGLVQKTGSGVTVESKGLTTEKSNSHSIAAGISVSSAQGSFALPAGAVIHDVKYIITDAITTQGGGTLRSRIGTNSNFNGTEIMTDKSIMAASTTAAVGAMTSASGANILVAGGAAPAFVDGAPLYSATARTIYYRIEVNSATLTDAGALNVALVYSVV